ncbi:helix-turn-helix transcriptional regulator [Actinomadura sp. 6K520]|uniref:helix-turn-helix domain-containing protein n=1 Tax=Actinomadura sp. 6K520 TaxID=2530364 RepID=UPI00104C516E|nr:helix-turn-helix transcriptional regulator [Actinomadura sp. 6K520]TDE33469.1 XRE family transcriptional regulator [Actinomadura sp. 6K520]
MVWKGKKPNKRSLGWAVGKSPHFRILEVLMPRRPRDPGTPSSPVEYFGVELRAYREAAGMSRPQLAQKLGYTPQWIGQVEAGQNGPSDKFAIDCDTCFATNGTFYRLWGWIQELGKLQVLPPGFRPYAEAEGDASYVKAFAPLLVPGLLQTPEYARAVLEVGQRAEKLEELLTVRLERQVLLTRVDSPLFLFVLGEYVVRRLVGSREVMCGQLEHLLTMASEPHITLQIVRDDAPVYQASGFVLLEFEERSQMCYMDSGGGYGPLLESPRDVNERAVAFDQVRSAALPTGDSVRFVRAVMEGL